MSTLIVVDDNELDRRIIQYSLVKYPIFDTILYYNDGRLLIDYLKDHQSSYEKLPDAVFLDLRMPGFDGWDVLDMMKEIYHTLCKDIKVYIVTASINSRDRFRALNYDFVKQFISKPVTRDILISIVNDVQNLSA